MSDELTVIAGRYELSSLVGEGGMASVWRAKDLTLARPVAVKLLYARDDRDRQALVDRFLREARIAASVQHRNVVHIVDFGTTDEQTPYMVMELLQGENLGERLSSEPPLTTSEFVHIAGMTLRGLSAVHKAEIVHRDLKPENIFLIEENGAPFPKILDFGISRSVQPASGRRSALTTKEGVIVGTPEYMSPEQARGVRTIDGRTDIYSMGAILYEGLTGRTPFVAENVGDLIIEIVTGTITPVSELNPNIPPSVSTVVEKALARSPEDRYQTAEEMQAALLSAADDLSEFRRSLSDFPPGMGTPPVSGTGSVRATTDSLEFQITLDGAEPVAEGPRPPTDPAVTLPARESGEGDTAHTTAEMEPFAVVATRRRKRVVVLVAALVIGTGAGLAWGGGEPEGEAVNVVSVAPDADAIRRASQAAVQQVAAAQAEAPAAAPAEEAKAESFALALLSVPPDATITLDSEDSGPPPLSVPNDGAEHVLVVSSSDGRSWTHRFTASEDTTLTVELPDKPVAQKRPATAKRKAASSKRPTRKPKGRGKKGMPSALRNLDF